MSGKFDRVILIVLDGVGCGEAPDAAAYGDIGSDTLGNVSKNSPNLKIPNLQRWGVGHLTKMPTTPPLPVEQTVASFGKCIEISKGKDTTTGHWEMAGVEVSTPFTTYPNGFDQAIIDQWCKENNLPGVLGNCTASGTEILKKFGEEHMKTGKPILYTSADSVWQIACHEETFGLERLYEISRSARKICDDLKIARVIARPFLGKTPDTFKRTHNRKDFSQDPPIKTMMEYVIDAGARVVGVGKIWNIFNGKGIQDSFETHDNNEGMEVTIDLLSKYKKALIFVNLIDCDMIYGHRRDIPGFAKALEDFDKYLPKLEEKLTERDLVILTGDHGNDPSYRGTDHTREFVPMIVYQKGAKAKNLGVRGSFADIGQTTVHALTGKANSLVIGTSILV